LKISQLMKPRQSGSDKIEQEIGNLNGISGDAVKKAILDVNEYVTWAAAAIEEQSAVTAEMSTGMQHAATEAASIGQAA